MRKSSKFIVLAGALAALAVPSVASASVTANPDGSGFVGKGDVQSALHYNNKQMQDDATLGGFTFTQQRDLTTEWSWTTSDGVTHNLARTESVTRPLSATLARENSKGKDGPVTGWNLNKLPEDRWGYVGGVYTPKWTGDDADGNGVVNQKDLFFPNTADVVLPDVNGDGIPDAPLQHFDFSVQVNGVNLPYTPAV